MKIRALIGLLLLLALPAVAVANTPVLTVSTTKIDSSPGTTVTLHVDPNGLTLNGITVSINCYSVTNFDPYIDSGTISDPTHGSVTISRNVNGFFNGQQVTRDVATFQMGANDYPGPFSWTSSTAFDLGTISMTGTVADNSCYMRVGDTSAYNTSSPAGDTMIASDVLLTVRRLFADADGNGAVGASDYTIYGNEFGHSCPTCCANFNNDGAVGVPDYLIYAAEFGHHGGQTTCNQGSSHCCGGGQ